MWPLRVQAGVSVSRFHNRHVLSPEPVASILPVGEKDAHKIGEAWPAVRIADGGGQRRAQRGWRSGGPTRKEAGEAGRN